MSLSQKEIEDIVNKVNSAKMHVDRATKFMNHTTVASLEKANLMCNAIHGYTERVTREVLFDIRNHLYKAIDEIDKIHIKPCSSKRGKIQ